MSRRALFVASELPWPPDGGGRIVSLRVLELLARTFDVDLVAFTDPAIRVDPAPLASLCRSVELISLGYTFRRHPLRQALLAAASVPTPIPYRLMKFRSGPMERAVQRKLSATTYELAHYEQLGVARYWRPDVPSTITAHNVEAAMYRLGSSHARGLIRRTWSRWEAARLERAEPALLRRFDHVFALSSVDADLLVRAGVRHVSVLHVPVEPAPTLPSAPPPGARVLSLGTMSWFGVEDGLLWFHDQVWPLVRQAVPGAAWDIVGPNPGPRIRAIADGERVIVHGYVPEVSGAIDAARVAIVPLQVAGGIRIKLLELLAAGRPAVATSVGAQGLSVGDGEGCFRRDDPAGFARAVVALLEDDALWRSTSRLGQEVVRREFSRDRAVATFEAGVREARSAAERRQSRLGASA